MLEFICTGRKPHQCTECGKRYTRKSYLARHELTHTREKPHKCTECGKRFTTKSNLTKHELTHTGDYS